MMSLGASRIAFLRDMMGRRRQEASSGGARYTFAVLVGTRRAAPRQGCKPALWLTPRILRWVNSPRCADIRLTRCSRTLGGRCNDVCPWAVDLWDAAQEIKDEVARIKPLHVA